MIHRPTSLPAAPRRTGTAQIALATVGVLVAGLCSVAAPGAASADDSTAVYVADTSATPDTLSLFRYLQDTEGNGLLFGQQHAIDESISEPGTGPDGASVDSDVFATTGDLPGVFGFDTLAIPGGEKPGSVDNTPEENADLLAQAFVRADALGGVVTLSAHMPNFVTGGSFNDTSGGDVVAQILPGGSANAAFTSYLDRIAQAAQGAVRSDGTLVPVLFRPFHENTGSWFWWGTGNTTAGEYKEIFRYTVEYLRDVKQVHNFLYAYSPNGYLGGDAQRYLETYPGDDWVDLMGYDYYQTDASDAGTAAYHTQVVTDLGMIASLADQHGKLAALTEFGRGGAATVTESGNENLDFFTGLLQAVRSDPAARNVSYMLTWANFSAASVYVPYPEHEMAADFRAFHDDPATLFAGETGGRGEYTATPADHSVFLRLVNPADGSRVTTSETTVRAKVTGIDPAEVGPLTFRVDDFEPITLVHGQDGYWSGTWNVGADALNNSTHTTHVEAQIDGQGATWDGHVILGTAPELAPGVVDDFEGYGDDAALRAAYTVNNASADALSLTQRGDGRGAALHYNLGAGGYIGFGRSFERAADWSDFAQLDTFIGSDGSGQKLVLQITTGDGTFEAYPSLEQASAGVVSVPWDEWVPAAWDTGHAGAKLTPQRLASVTGFWVYVNDVAGAAAHSGELVFDDIRATGQGTGYEPKPGEVSAIDDFESYADEAALRTTWGGRGKTDLLTLRADAADGAQAMAFSSNAASGSWIDVSRGVDGGWDGSDGFAFSYRGDGSNGSLFVQVGTSAGNYWVTSVLLNSTGWKDVVIPWSSFVPGWPATLTAPIGDADLATVRELVLAISPASGTAGTIGIDTIGVTHTSVDPQQTAPAVTTQPVGVTVADGARATFTAGASGVPAPAVQWERAAAGSTQWAAVFGATQAELKVDAAYADSGARYRAVFTNSVGSVTTSEAALTVTATTPVITAQPKSLTVSPWKTARMTVAAEGTGPLTYRWSVQLPGTRKWIRVGSNSPTLTVIGLITPSGTMARVTVEGPGGSVTSTPAKIVVTR